MWTRIIIGNPAQLLNAKPVRTPTCCPLCEGPVEVSGGPGRGFTVSCVRWGCPWRETMDGSVALQPVRPRAVSWATGWRAERDRLLEEVAGATPDRWVPTGAGEASFEVSPAALPVTTAPIRWRSFREPPTGPAISNRPKM